MSLEDDKGLKVETIMGKTVIPFGIEEIRQHVEEIDEIPLQI